MSFKSKQLGRLPNLRDGAPLLTPGSGMGVDVALLTPQKLTLKLSSATLSVTAANDYGSLELLTWPDRNLHILGAEFDLTLVKQGNTNGIIATTDLDVGVGSAAASATTLAGAMIDFLEKQDIDDNALTVECEAHVLGQSTATFPKQQADGASNKLYLNAVAVGGITADSSLSVSGYVDLYVIDLGNRTS